MKRINILAIVGILLLASYFVSTGKNTRSKNKISKIATKSIEAEKQTREFKLLSEQKKTELPAFHTEEVLNKKISRYRDLSEKVILTPGEITARELIYADKELIEYNLSTLLDIKARKHTLEEEGKRYDSLEFFVKAIRLESNPGREFVKSKIAEYLEKIQISDNFEINQKKSIAVDMINMFQLLASVDRDWAEQILSQHSSKRAKRIFRYALKVWGK